MRKIIRLLLVLNIAFSGCATVPRSVGNGVFLGEKPELSTERLHNAEVDEYISNLLERVTAYADKDYRLSVNVLATGRVQGVFSFMFNEVEVTRGMLNVITNESELACLLAHEVGHCALKHDERFKRDNTLDKVLSFALGLFIKNRSLKDRLLRHQKEISDSGWGKKLEMEADRYGAELAVKAGYNPYAFSDLFDRLAGKVDDNVIYRLNKIKGTHPALESRAKELRKYLEGKGYPQSAGKVGAGVYQSSLSSLVNVSAAKQSQAALDSAARDALASLDKIISELENNVAAKQPLALERYLTIMETVADVAKRYDIGRDDIFPDAGMAPGPQFMEEEIYQDIPLWAEQAGIRAEILQKARNIFSLAGHVGVGAIPGAGDAVDLYELVAGRDLFTGEKLNSYERRITALGLLVGSGSSWRQFARGIDSELAAVSSRVIANNITEARHSLKEAVACFENGSDWKRIYSKTANLGYKPDKLPYWKGVSVYETSLSKTAEFYRVHGYTNQIGNWLVDFNPSKFTAVELKDTLALPAIPTAYSKVTVMPGTRLRVGVAGKIQEYGRGGIVQWQILTGNNKLEEIGLVFEKLGEIK